MVRAHWQGGLVAMLIWAGIGHAQQVPSTTNAPESHQRLIAVQQTGREPQKCKVLNSWRTQEGATAYDVQALDTGELITIVEMAGAPVNANSQGGVRAATAMRIFRWENPTKPPAGAPRPPAIVSSVSEAAPSPAMSATGQPISQVLPILPSRTMSQPAPQGIVQPPTGPSNHVPTAMPIMPPQGLSNVERPKITTSVAGANYVPGSPYFAQPTSSAQTPNITAFKAVTPAKTPAATAVKPAVQTNNSAKPATPVASVPSTLATQPTTQAVPKVAAPVLTTQPPSPLTVTMPAMPRSSPASTAPAQPVVAAPQPADQMPYLKPIPPRTSSEPQMAQSASTPTGPAHGSEMAGMSPSTSAASGPTPAIHGTTVPTGSPHVTRPRSGHGGLPPTTAPLKTVPTSSERVVQTPCPPAPRFPGCPTTVSPAPGVACVPSCQPYQPCPPMTCTEIKSERRILPSLARKGKDAPAVAQVQPKPEQPKPTPPSSPAPTVQAEASPALSSDWRTSWGKTDDHRGAKPQVAVELPRADSKKPDPLVEPDNFSRANDDLKKAVEQQKTREDQVKAASEKPSKPGKSNESTRSSDLEQAKMDKPAGVRSVIAAHADGKPPVMPIPVMTIPPVTRPRTPAEAATRQQAPFGPTQSPTVPDDLRNAFTEIAPSQGNSSQPYQMAPGEANAFTETPNGQTNQQWMGYPPYAMMGHGHHPMMSYPQAGMAMPPTMTRPGFGGYGPMMAYAGRYPLPAPGQGRMAPNGGYPMPNPMPIYPGLAPAMYAAVPPAGYPGGPAMMSMPSSGYAHAASTPRDPAFQPPIPPVVPTVQDGYKPLVGLLRDALYPSHREMAADTLANSTWKSHPHVVDALLESAREDPAPSVRAACVRNLAKVRPNDPILASALEQLKNDSDPVVRQEIDIVLASYKSTGEEKKQE